MNNPATPGAPSLATTDDLPGRLGAILHALVVAITTFFIPRPACLIAINPVCAYILRTRARLARLIPRLLAGHTPRLRTPAPPNPTSAPRATPRIRLSQVRGWLLQDADHWVRGHRGQLETLLADPAAAQLLAAHPAAGRLLRPLCRMLAIDAPCLAQPPRARPPRKPRIPKPRQPTYAERRAALRYSNSEGKPMNLLPPRRSRHL